MSHRFFVDSGSIDELLIEVFQLKENGLRFIGDKCSEKQKGFSDVVDDGFKRFSGVNWTE